MNIAEFQLQAVGDPRLAVYVASGLPAWLWSVDGARVLWANPVGAKVFGDSDGIALATRRFGPADAHRRQVAQLGGKLLPSGAIRLERLRGFGAPLGNLVTCGCARLDLADGSDGILVAAAEAVGPTMPLVERLQRLIEGFDAPLAAFARDGRLVGVNEAARPLLGFRDLFEGGFEQARIEALRQGRVETSAGHSRMVLHRVGSGAEISLVALIVPAVGADDQQQLHGAQSRSGATENEPRAECISSDINHGAAKSPAAANSPSASASASSSPPDSPIPLAIEASQQTEEPKTPVETPVEPPVETPLNVLPFRPIGEPKSPSLTPVENSAFDELARQLSARLERENGAAAATAAAKVEIFAAGPVVPKEAREKSDQSAWLAEPELPPRSESRRDRRLLDLLPVGVLIYRLDRLVYANPAFLTRMGFSNLFALEEAGGLDALYVEPGVSSASSTSDTGTPVSISASQGEAPAIDARLYTINWDEDSAPALIFSGTAKEGAVAAALGQAAPASEPSPVGHANAEELGAILDTTADGIVMFDADGNLNSCNRSAEALFGCDGDKLMQRNLVELFAPESHAAVSDYLASIKGAGLASLLDHGRDVLGLTSDGGVIPLSMTMGRTRHDGPNFFAVFRDLSQTRKNESELQQARRLADRAANAKADLLARISHEVRTPLNAIIGFAEVMVDERFGALGNERYHEYMKDIRASGERVIAIINGLLDLSRIETGRLELTFADQNLNDLVEQCVAVMQPQANRGRTIIRTSMAHALPPVLADAHSLRQIALNLIGNSIHLASAGGQVIVSTALTDFGEVALRVRDTGHGLNDNEVAAAMEPFRTQAPPDQASERSGVNLSLTKALVEANRAQFHIRNGSQSGTLIEVVFSRVTART
jgi:PAS domain S-box-containing protein